MKYITFCPNCNDEGVPSERHPAHPCDELCQGCNSYLHTRTPETRDMKKPVLMVKYGLYSPWRLLFNYNPRDAVPAYIAYLDQCYPNEADRRRFKIVDLEAWDGDDGLG